MDTVFTGHGEILCPIHVPWVLRGRQEDLAGEWYHCIECGDPVEAAEVWMDDDGPRCEFCARAVLMRAA